MTLIICSAVLGGSKEGDETSFVSRNTLISRFELLTLIILEKVKIDDLSV